MNVFTEQGRGLGCVRMWLRDARAKNYPATAFIKSSVMKREVDMSDVVFVPPDQSFANQEVLQECVGWAIGGIIYTAQIEAGIRVVEPSPSAIYYQARARAYGYREIWDGGCNPNEAWQALLELGLVNYKDWPHSIPNVNKASPSAYQKAFDEKWFEYRWVLSSGVSRTQEACALLSSRKSLAVAFRIDQGMEDWKPGHEPWKRTGPIIGGHAVQIVGYRTLSTGRIVFVYANSWGDRWGDKGFGLASQEAIESSETSYIATAEIKGDKIW